MSLSGPQRLCVAAIVVGFAISLTGSVSPYWEYISFSADGVSVEAAVGLIFECASGKIASPSAIDCKLIDWDPPVESYVGDFVYLKAVRVLMAVSVFCGLCSAIAGLILCCSTASTSARSASVCALMAGLTGVSGVVTFAIYSEKNFFTVAVPAFLHPHKAWAFYMSAAGSGLMILLAIVTLLAPKEKPMYISSTVQLQPTKGYGRFY